MSVEANKEVVRRFYKEAVTDGDIDLIDKLAHEGMTDHAAIEFGWGEGRNGFKTHVETVRTIVPNFHAEISELIGEDDIVICYWTATGIAEDAFLGVEPNGKPFSANAISRLRFEGGRIAEYQVMAGPLTTT